MFSLDLLGQLPYVFYAAKKKENCIRLNQYSVYYYKFIMVDSFHDLNTRFNVCFW